MKPSHFPIWVCCSCFTLHQLGIIYSARKEYDRAVTSFERAIDIFSALGMEYEKHLTLSYSSQTFVFSLSV